MAEEFFESDVVFSDNHNSSSKIINNNHSPFADVDTCSRFDRCRRELVVAAQHQQQEKGKKNSCGSKKTVASSVPVNIPQGMMRMLDSDEDEDDEDEMVPPHVIVRRRVAGKMAFSVCTGQGRTLKGRDLSQVRNSILRMTGFLEV